MQSVLWVNLVSITIAACWSAALVACPVLHGSAPSMLRDLAPAWVAGFERINPPCRIILTLPFGPPQGSLAPALEAFLDGQADFAFLTRDLAERDLAAFRRGHDGADAVIVPVAGGAWNHFGFVDAVVIIVHRSNPIRRLSFKQLAAVYSRSQGEGAPDWGVLGNRGWHGHPVHLAGGDAWAGEESARALTIRRRIFASGSKSDEWRAAPSSGGKADVVARVGADPLAIGFTGFGHVDGNVRVVAIAATDRGPAYRPTRRTALSGRYPLLRSVDLLMAQRSDKSFDPLLVGFMRYLVGTDGQDVVRRNGQFIPLTPNERNRGFADFPAFRRLPLWRPADNRWRASSRRRRALARLPKRASVVAVGSGDQRGNLSFHQCPGDGGIERLLGAKPLPDVEAHQHVNRLDTQAVRRDVGWQDRFETGSHQHPGAIMLLPDCGRSVAVGVGRALERQQHFIGGQPPVHSFGDLTPPIGRDERHQPEVILPREPRRDLREQAVHIAEMTEDAA